MCLTVLSIILNSTPCQSRCIIFFYPNLNEFLWGVITIGEMARLEAQESAEYYKWLLWIERVEFKKELLEIVSIITLSI